MVALIVLFAMFGVALAAGWVAQLLVGKRPIDWTQAGWVGLVGTAIAGGIAWLFDRHVATVFSVTGLVLAILVSFVIEWLVVRREVAERREEHHREHELTPEGLPGHHQPKKRKTRRR